MQATEVVIGQVIRKSADLTFRIADKPDLSPSALQVYSDRQNARTVGQPRQGLRWKRKGMQVSDRACSGGDYLHDPSAHTIPGLRRNGCKILPIIRPRHPRIARPESIEMRDHVFVAAIGFCNQDVVTRRT